MNYRFNRIITKISTLILFFLTALQVVSKHSLATFETFEIVFQDCPSPNVTIDFGDCTAKITAKKCNFSHIYKRPGIHEVRIVLPGYETSRNLVYVEEAVALVELLVVKTEFSLNDGFSGQWRITNGTTVRLTISYGDGSNIWSYLVGNINGTLLGNHFHTYSNAGVYEIAITVFNNVSSVNTSKLVVMEIPVVIGNITVLNLSPFERIYQFDYFKVIVDTINGSNPNYHFNFNDGKPATNRTLPEMFYRHTIPETLNLTIIVFNNVSFVNRSHQIVIEKIVPLQKFNINLLDTNITDPTEMALNITEGSPYVCRWTFGDGQQTNSTSDYPPRIYHNFSDIGMYTVSVCCSNYFGNKTAQGTAVIQQPIIDVAFSNNAPREQNETMEFSITAENLGTNSCCVLNFGDETVIGFGLSHCHKKYQSVSFLETKKLPITVEHTYYSIGEYVVNLEISNKVSRVSIQDRAVIVKIPCNYPNITIFESIGKSFHKRTQIYRWQELTLDTDIRIDCKATQLVDMVWILYKLSPSGSAIDNGSVVSTQSDKFIVKKRSYQYGFYLIRFNVSMHGQQGVYSYDDAYFHVIASPLVPVLDGGTAVLRKFGTITTVSGLLSWDPDFFDVKNFEYYWFCQNSKHEIPTNLSNLSNAFSLNLLNVCDIRKLGILQRSGPTVKVNTAELIINETYDLLLIIKNSVNGLIRMQNTTQKMTITEGDPPEMSIRYQANLYSTLLICSVLYLIVFQQIAPHSSVLCCIALMYCNVLQFYALFCTLICNVCSPAFQICVRDWSKSIT